ncbi:MAG TPA: hypothetical protein VJ761_03705 [Ktedonobacteraceae bacterium]|nr:hypothetical protein [Ktedonobacteraceae bacterium]
MKQVLRAFLTILATIAIAGISLMPVQQAFASGSIFQIVPSPNGSKKPISNNLLVGVTSISASDMWAVGDFNGKTLAEHWDGAKWTLVKSPNGKSGSQFTAVSAVSSNDVWAVGIQDTAGPATGLRTLIEHWDGTKWKVIPSPNASSEGDDLYAVTAISTNDVWAVGYFENDSQTLILPLLEHWDGKSWTIFQVPSVFFSINFVYGVSAVSTSDIWAAGYTIGDGGDNENLLLHWDGTQWTVLPPVPVQSDGNRLQAITAISSTDVWAVGEFNVNRGENSSNLALHWNGQQWSQRSVPNSGGLTNALEGVTALASNDVWAVGLAAQPPSGFNQTLIEHWNGKSWSIAPSPNMTPQKDNPNTLFAATAVSPGNIMAVGTWDSFKKGNPGERTLTVLTTQG